MSLESAHFGPWLGTGSAPIHIEQSHRNSQFLMKATGHVGSHCGKTAGGLRSRNAPAGIDIFLPLSGEQVGSLDTAEPGQIAGSDLFLGIHRLANRPLHIRLPPTQPNHTYQNVFEHPTIVSATDHHFAAFGTGLHRCQIHTPGSALIRRRRHGLPCKGHRDLSSGIGHSPDWNFAVHLQDGVIADHRRHIDGRFRGVGGRKGQAKEKRKNAGQHEGLLRSMDLIDASSPRPKQGSRTLHDHILKSGQTLFLKLRIIAPAISQIFRG